MLESRIVRFLVACAALVLLWWVYAPALTGAQFYDDFGNLEGLNRVTTPEAQKQFVFGGKSGPLGRPVALATFLPHASGWPANGPEILAVNVGIHVANVALVGVLGYLCLGLAGFGGPARRSWIAFGAAFLWGAMPLLASTSLIIIQRMTSLAAFFSLLGLIGFVAAYRLQAARPLLGFVLQFGALGAGTLLAMYTKENGALTPLFALVIHTLLAPKTLTDRRLAFLQTLLLWSALIAILAYLSPFNREWFTVSERRGWSGYERLQTQMVVLWEYVRAAFLPLPSLYSPFHDHRSVDYTGWPALLGFLAWAGVVALCVWLKRTKAVVWPLFAVMWFLIGHLLESTIVMLEIYFEHRNYLPLYGACLALAVGAASVQGALKRIGPMLFGAYAAIQLAVLLALTTFWGDPDRSAELWAHENPASSRASVHLALRAIDATPEQIADLNFEFIQMGRYERAIQIFDRTLESCPQCMGIRLQALLYSCLIYPSSEQEERMEAALENVRNARQPRMTAIVAFRLRELINSDRCRGVSRESLLSVVEQLDENVLFRIEHVRARLLFLAAALEEDVGNPQRRDEFLDRAENVFAAAVPVLQYQVYSSIREGRFDDALAAVARRRPLVGLTSGALTASLLDGLEREIAQARSEAVNEQS
ncbi:hypothetical protein [Pseudazoarcus pumilus]|uniref:Tetratricopeptide repeat protein n=1 Tax=Pseudazoarcus pumilus TaxID=2067960 RepID=A0A2I6S3Q1_9RHOO|nr:hypothetical protein [Pseudazoarcus pumilus]AUN93891.1 hypothetical protein C0099_02390 [Pseudazoarcus pumilus]